MTKHDPNIAVESAWKKRYVRLSGGFLIFFPIWFTLVFFVGLHFWLLFEVEWAQVEAQVHSYEVATQQVSS